MARAGRSGVEPLKQPRGLVDLALREAGQARTDFAAIEDGLEFIMAQVSKVPTKRELGWVAAGSFIGGALIATLVNLVFFH
jgi:hypothetical protein